MLTLALAAAAAFAADEPGSREREALRRAQASLRQAQEAAQQLQAKVPQLEAEKAKLGQERDQAAGQAQRLRRELAEARDQAAKIDAELTRTKAAAAEAQRLADDAARDAATRLQDGEKQRAKLAADLAERSATVTALGNLLERSTQALADAETANKRLYAVAQQAINRYRGKTAFETTVQDDPVVGLTAVRLESIAEQMRIEAEQVRLRK
jgi:chromosome segregation ATPase